MTKKTKKYDIFKENCGDDSPFIAFISIMISILSFSLFSNLIEGTVNTKTLYFFIIRIVCWYVFAIAISKYYYYIKRSEVR